MSLLIAGKVWDTVCPLLIKLDSVTARSSKENFGCTWTDPIQAVICHPVKHMCMYRTGQSKKVRMQRVWSPSAIEKNQTSRLMCKPSRSKWPLLPGSLDLTGLCRFPLRCVSHLRADHYRLQQPALDSSLLPIGRCTSQVLLLAQSALPLFEPIGSRRCFSAACLSVGPFETSTNARSLLIAVQGTDIMQSWQVSSHALLQS